MSGPFNLYIRRSRSIYAWIIVGYYRLRLCRDVVNLIARLVHAEPPDFTEYYRLQSNPRPRYSLICDEKFVHWELFGRDGVIRCVEPCRTCFLPFCGIHVQNKDDFWWGIPKALAQRWIRIQL